MKAVKQKPRQRTVGQQRRVTTRAKKQRRSLHDYALYLPIFVVLVLGIAANSVLAASRHSVLGYATDISVQSLLDQTNIQRTSNSIGSLALNAQLDQAAQAKADDMSARDYWSHNTPDGQSPWTFITAAGYAYQTAGENLAYGFTTTSDTITGWMNSAEHRANILNGAFTNVGFGITNSPNYQGSGAETIIVAMYAAPATPAVAAATAPPNTPPTTTATPTAPPASTPASSTAMSQQDVPATTVPAPHTATNPGAIAKAPEPQPQHLSRIALIAHGQAVPITAVSILAVIGIAFFLTRHLLAWHKFLVKSERFVVHHPSWDVAAVSIVVICVLLSQSLGTIR